MRPTAEPHWEGNDPRILQAVYGMRHGLVRHCVFESSRRHLRWRGWPKYSKLATHFGNELPRLILGRTERSRRGFIARPVLAASFFRIELVVYALKMPNEVGLTQAECMYLTGSAVLPFSYIKNGERRLGLN
jgi:hypothetical protein